MTSPGSPPSPTDPDSSRSPRATSPGHDPSGRSEEWLAELFGLHSRAVHAYARRRVDCVEDAEDVVVEVFTAAWRRRLDVPAEALPWLYATAANVIAHVVRSDARRTRLGARLATVSPLHPAPDPSDAVADAVAARHVVTAALADLAESDAELLRLWSWEQLGPTQIAEVLGCTPGTARTRLHRARSRLRATLVNRGVADAQLGPTDAEEPTAPATDPPPGSSSHGPTRPQSLLSGYPNPRAGEFRRAAGGSVMNVPTTDRPQDPLRALLAAADPVPTSDQDGAELEGSDLDGTEPTWARIVEELGPEARPPRPDRAAAAEPRAIR